MGHADENNNLLWSNGGLMNCKANSAADDFNENRSTSKLSMEMLRHSKPIIASQ